MITPGFPEGCVASLAGRQRCRVTVVSFPVGVSSGVDAGNAYFAACRVLCALCHWVSEFPARLCAWPPQMILSVPLPVGKERITGEGTCGLVIVSCVVLLISRILCWFGCCSSVVNGFAGIAIATRARTIDIPCVIINYFLTQ
jgi:hypothetical protein